MAMNYSIHFHVWDARSFINFLDRTRAYLGNTFDVEHFSVNGAEIVAILKKRDASSPDVQSWLSRKKDGIFRFLSACRADWTGRLRASRTALGRASNRPTRPASQGAHSG